MKLDGKKGDENMATVRKRVLEKIGTGELRQALDKYDWPADEIDYIIFCVEGR